MQENDRCDICKRTVSEDEEGLLCDGCLIWKHRTCLSLGQKSYQKLAKSKNQWFCDTCKPNSAKDPKIQKTTNQQASTEYTIADVMAKLDEMDKKYHNLFMKYNEQVQINNDLKLEILQIKKQLNKSEQKDLNKNITVHGVPYRNGENAVEIVKKIADQLQVPMADEKFTAFRLGRTNIEKSPIKVVFQNEETKKNILRSKLKVGLNTQSIGFRENNKIYLNHDLTKHNLKLFKEAQKFKKDNGYKFLWISSGNILLRKEENSKIILVEDEEDLKN